jgi:tetratricopeptide (TPR) repeat protein
MADAVRHDEGSPASAAARTAHIEELLLAGLDHYFSGEHELAINVWTRVLFLDRAHSKARAYIERARGAIAEKQREGEELLQTGVAAFQRGDADDARRLLTSAADRGASRDEALALLDRLDRLAPAPDVDERVVPAVDVRRRARPVRGPDSIFRPLTIAAVLMLGLASGALVVLYLTNGPLARNAPAATSATPRLVEPVPVPAPSEVALRRARLLASKGRLHEALDMLETVRPGDPLRGEADDLEGAIQRQLLESAHAARGSPAPAPSR